MQKVILDVDTGVDDALALLLAVRSGAFDIAGITTVCGNVPLELATANTQKVLQVLGRCGTVKVIRGADRPLVRTPRHEQAVHGNDGLGGALADVSAAPADPGVAADFMIEQAWTHPGELTFILLAPLTNAALALRKEPKLAGMVKRLVIMGGVASGPGNMTPTSEYNAFADPEAAKIVFQSGAPITMVGLDVTRKALLPEQRLSEIGDPALQQFVRACTKRYIDRYEQRNGVRACVMHDPLAVAVAMDETLVQTRRLFVDVETRSELCDGQTVCDFFNRLNRPPNADVCLEVDADRFIQLYLDRLNRSVGPNN